MRTGLDLGQVLRLTAPLGWRRLRDDDEPIGAGAYAWFGDRGNGDLVYAGQSAHVVERLRRQTRWSRDADYPGVEAFSRLVARHDAAPLYAVTADHDAARDIEALIGAANVHVCGCPPSGWGLAWAPRSARSVTAWDRALAWAKGEVA